MTIDISTNKYIKEDPANNYIIDTKELGQEKNQYITIDTNSISLIESTTNHYLHKLSIGNCERQWQDWFCIPNYHNSNMYNSYPNTKNMDVGACFKYCNSQDNNAKKVGRNNDDMYKSNNTKCSLFEDENELIYNPLAIIAIIGTHFNNENSTPDDNFHTFSETIGLRGSYLNELWQVNTDSNLDISKIPKQDKAYNAIDKDKTITNQEKLLMKIIYKYGISNNKPIQIKAIGDINEDINEAYYRLIARNKYGKRYYTQNNEFKNNFLKKIKNYVFDIDSLENAYGTNKKGTNNMINIIAYAYNIMRLICFKQNTAPSAVGSLPVSLQVSPKETIKANIIKIMGYKGILQEANTEEDQNFIIQMFKYACFNCFNTNFDIFEKYINDIDPTYLTDATKKFPCDSSLLKNPTSIIYYNSFIKLEGIDLSNEIIAVKRIYDYYDNIEEYNHNVMYEYAENTTNIILILMIFAILLAFVLAFGILYAFLSRINAIPFITKRVNFCHLFYEGLFYGIIMVFCNSYYYLCKNSNSYSIGSIITNICNILLIIFAFGMLYYALMELLNVDYISLLNKIRFEQLPTNWFDDESDAIAFRNMIMYIFLTYFIGIFFYSIYIIRYSLSDFDYDIIGNRDADSKISTKYLNYILLKTHNEGLLSKFVNIYTEIINEGDVPSAAAVAATVAAAGATGAGAGAGAKPVAAGAGAGAGAKPVAAGAGDGAGAKPVAAGAGDGAGAKPVAADDDDDDDALEKKLEAFKKKKVKPNN
jgi:hypothetical protein